MIAVDLGQARGQRAVDVDRDRPHLVDGEQLLKAVNHALGAPQAEGRDDDLALQPGGPGDDGVQLLHQAVVGIELAVAVGALGDQDIDVLDRRRIGQQMGVAAAQVAGEDEAAGAAVFAIVELHDRRAENVPGVEVGQGHARHDFHRLVVGNALEPLDHPLDVGQVKERLGSLDVRVFEMGVAHFLTLDARTVAKHDVGDVARGGRREDRSRIASPDQARETADVVVVGVRDDHRVERAGVKRELAVGAVGIDSVGIEQPAVEQDPLGIDLQQMSAARDRSGRAVERDSQPNYLPTIDRAPAMRQRHAACAMLGNAIGT